MSFGIKMRILKFPPFVRQRSLLLAPLGFRPLVGLDGNGTHEPHAGWKAAVWGAWLAGAVSQTTTRLWPLANCIKQSGSSLNSETARSPLPVLVNSGQLWNIKAFALANSRLDFPTLHQQRALDHSDLSLGSRESCRKRDRSSVHIRPGLRRRHAALIFITSSTQPREC